MRVIVTLAALVLVGGCRSVVSGHGAASVGVRSPSGPTGFPNTTAPAPTPTSTPSGFGRFARTPISTAIGDPATADLCAAIGLSALGGLGYPPRFNPQQLPPGCSVQLTRNGTRVGSVTVYATPDQPSSRPGRTTTALSGLRTYVYRYEPSYGDCERDVVAPGVVLSVHAFPNEIPSGQKQSVACRGADAMAKRVAQMAAGHAVPRLALASPSLTGIDACAVIKASGLLSSGRFAGMKVAADAFGSGCQLSKGTDFFYFDVGIAQQVPPANTRPVTAGAHTLYAGFGNGSGYCTFTSVQGATAGGRHEVFEVSGSGSGSDAALCDDTQQALVRYLDTVGLR